LKIIPRFIFHIKFFKEGKILLYFSNQHLWNLFDTSQPDTGYDVSGWDDVVIQPITSREPQLYAQSELIDLV
jgi:hypothetical protein